MQLSDRAAIKTFTADGIWGEATLPALFRSTAQRCAGQLAVCDPPNKQDVLGGRPLKLTYSELGDAVANLVGTFRELGLHKDDVVAVQLPNTVEQVAVFLAALEYGLIVSPLPLLWREHEMRLALPCIAPRLLISATQITGRQHAEMMCAVAVNQMSVRGVLAFGADVPDGVIPLDGIFSQRVEATGNIAPHRPDPVGANDIATICWAGSEALLPSAVPRSHNQWIAAGMMQVLEAGLERGGTILTPYPLTSLIAIGGFFVPWLLNGGTLCLHHPFDVATFVTQLRSHPVSFTGLPPSVIDVLRNDGAFEEREIAASLAAIACIWPGLVVPKNAENHAADLMVPVIDVRTIGEMAYHARRRVAGERPGLLGHGDIAVPSRQVGSAVLLSTRVRGGISANGGSASLLTGDLMIRSPMMFDAYYPPVEGGVDAPVLARDRDGYVNTGLRCLITGSTIPKIEIVRRNGNAVFIGGLTVSAAELDSLYAEFDGVADAAAFPFDDPVMGERIMAAIVPEPGATITLRGLSDYLKRRCVAPYKLPDQLVTVSMIPRDRNGAVMREQVLEHTGDKDDATARVAAAASG
jgi:non-ribosomal peptide synthetase component E (peptide arylation enzyme)